MCAWREKRLGGARMGSAGARGPRRGGRLPPNREAENAPQSRKTLRRAAVHEHAGPPAVHGANWRSRQGDAAPAGTGFVSGALSTAPPPSSGVSSSTSSLRPWPGSGRSSTTIRPGSSRGGPSSCSTLRRITCSARCPDFFTNTTCPRSLSSSSSIGRGSEIRSPSTKTSTGSGPSSSGMRCLGAHPTPARRATASAPRSGQLARCGRACSARSRLKALSPGPIARSLAVPVATAETPGTPAGDSERRPRRKAMLIVAARFPGDRLRALRSCARPHPRRSRIRRR